MNHIKFGLLASSMLLMHLPISAQTTTQSASVQSTPTANAAAVANNYVAGVYSSYQNALKAAEEMQAAITKFTDAPSTDSLNNARRAWVKAHEIYSLTEVYRFYDGPIDAPETGPEPLLNAWPMDEAYVDYVQGQPEAGIINMPGEYPEINDDLLVSMNEKDGEKNISTGFHAIEFLLWGQDQSTTGPGNRPYTDYVAADNNNAKRRAQYLNLVTELLVKHLKEVQQAWDPASDNYARQFKALAAGEQIRRMLTGIAMMAGDELSQERLVVPMETRDQEDEQSCFSDTTLIALKQDLQGIRQVYTGKYSSVSGPGLADLVAAEDAELDKRIREKIDSVAAAFEAVPLPFDQALQSEQGRGKIEAVVTGLEDLADLLVEAASKLNVTVNLT